MNGYFHVWQLLCTTAAPAPPLVDSGTAFQL
jgi:hypothetical protein